MKIHTIPVGELQVNCYIIYDEATSECLVVDPGSDADIIISFVKSNNLKLKYIVLTHGHWDHIKDIGLVKQSLGGEILIHTLDKDYIQDPGKNMAYFLGGYFDIPTCDRTLENGDIIKLGTQEFVVIHTPGHTLGGICLLSGNTLISGDTLFKGTYGRCDLPGGDYNKIKDSIINKLFVLDGEIIVYPGHGDKTTILSEKENLIFNF